MQSNRLHGYVLALVAACLWATLGLFYTALEAYGLPRLTIVFCRAALTSTILFPILAWRRRDWLRLDRRDWLLIVALGISVAVLYNVYINAIALIGMGMAAVLMYTAPAWVALLSAIFLKERLSFLKGAAVALACFGCALIGQVYDLTSVRLNLLGILTGLATGLSYGLYTLFGQIAQRRYTSWSTLAYALGLGALFMLPLQSPTDLARALTEPAALFWLLVLGLVPTLGGGVTFMAALRRIPATNALVVATLEPVVAALLGWAFLGERLEIPQLLGASLILAAVAILQKAPG